MNYNSKSRNRFIHLYNPNKEGMGSYDANYINAYKKDKYYNEKLKENAEERFAA
tara:strand:- start:126 stop:287 length:162 start_codon:yes stop_codon:yes gene_type:complete